MSSLKARNPRTTEPSYLPSPSVQLALNKSLWDEQSEKEVGEIKHHLSLGRWSQPLAAPEGSCPLPLAEDASREENFSDAVSSPNPESCPTRVAREAEVPGS